MPTILSLADGTVPPWPRFIGGGGRGTCLEVCAGPRLARTVSVAVRACQRQRARRHGHIADSVVATNIAWRYFAQVRGHIKVRAGAVCKTVGSAYVGSNPTPATTSGNGPHAAETRPGGPFPSRHVVYQCVSLRVDIWQCARTYGVQRPGKTSGAYNRSLCPLRALETVKSARWHQVARWLEAARAGRNPVHPGSGLPLRDRGRPGTLRMA
jgi:hypothetical protein